MDADCEPPPEDGNIEEKTPPRRVRLDELAEQLDIMPNVVLLATDASLATAASAPSATRASPSAFLAYTGARAQARAMKSTPVLDICESLKLHPPHAAIALSDLSSAVATGGTWSDTEVQSDDPSADEFTDMDTDEWTVGSNFPHNSSDVCGGPENEHSGVKEESHEHKTDEQ